MSVEAPRWEAAPQSESPPARDAMAEVGFHRRGVLSESLEILVVALGKEGAPPWEEP